MLGSGELLEPFVERDFASKNMYRRGSVIVISSVEDSQSGLLETFQPRNEEACDDQDDTANDIVSKPREIHDSIGGDVTIEKSAGMTKEPPVDIKKELARTTCPNSEFKSRSSNSVVDFIWDSLPAMSWPTSSSPPPLLSKTESALELKDAELKSSRWKKAMVTVKDTDDFRRLKKEMRSTKALTGGGAHQAMMQLLQKQRDDNTKKETGTSSTRSLTPPTGRASSRPLRRRSNSFSGYPSMMSTADTNLRGSNSSLQINLSPFISDDDF